MAVQPEASEITMGELRQACNERLNYAIASGDPNVLVVPLGEDDSDVTSEEFETEAGLRISRIRDGSGRLGLLIIECDFGELDSCETRVTKVEFMDDQKDPVDVTEIHNDRSKTVARKKFNRVASELVKYVTLIP